MAQERRFVKGSAKKRTFENGGEVIKVNLSIADLLRLPMNRKGYVYLEIASKKNWPDEYGRTHNISLDEYDPEDTRRENPDMKKVADYLEGNISKVHLEEWKDDDWNDLPF